MAVNASIDPAEGGWLTYKQAFVSIISEMLPEAVRVLSGIGISFVGTLDADPAERMLKFIITGDALPDACLRNDGERMHEVLPLFSMEEKDHVRTEKFVGWRIVEPPPPVIHFRTDDDRIRAIVSEEVRKLEARIIDRERARQDNAWRVARQ